MKQAKQPEAVADFIHNMGIRSFIDPVRRALSGHLRIERLRDGERLLDLRQRRRAYRPDLRDAHRRPAGQPDRHLHSRIAGRRIGAHGLHDAHDAAKRRDERNGRLGRNGSSIWATPSWAARPAPRSATATRGPRARPRSWWRAHGSAAKTSRCTRPTAARCRHHGPADRRRILLRPSTQNRALEDLQAGHRFSPRRARDGVRLRGGDAAVAGGTEEEEGFFDRSRPGQHSAA